MLNKVIPLIIAVLILPTAALSAVKVTDSFEYGSVEELRSKWSILNSGFLQPLQVTLTQKYVKEGKKALLLQTSAVGDTTGTRIDLDITLDIPLKDVQQVRFWIYIDNPQNLAQTGIHMGDKDWTNHFSKFGYMSFSKGWQRVFVSRDSLVTGGGNPTWETATQMRLTFWFAPNSQPTRIILDDVSWSQNKERDQILNKKWYD